MKKADSEKLAQLYALYEQPMFRIAYAVLHHEDMAEDAVSDAFMRIIRHLHKIKDPQSPESRHYMVKVIRSCAFSQYRKLQKQAEREMPLDETVTQFPEAPEKTDFPEELVQQLQILEHSDRQLLVLRCRDDFSWKQISHILGISEVCARKRFERLRKRILQKGA